ncbi:MAG TPA: hypothetical protein VL357_02470 [Rariglobus sp.]|jgi:hypothetical protein|nr:hypothetical protein [Rariglobus sp.]
MIEPDKDDPFASADAENAQMAEQIEFSFGGRRALKNTEPDSADREANFEKYVERGKRSLALNGIEWESTSWRFHGDDPVAKKNNAHRSYQNELMFANRATSKKGSSRLKMEARVAMRQPFLDFARANIRLHAESSSPNITILRKRMAVLAILEELLIEDTGEANPTGLSVAHFDRAEKQLLAEFAIGTAYKMSGLLADIGATVDRYRIGTQQVRYATRIKRPNDGDELTPEGQSAGAEKMVSEDALRALAEISCNPDTFQKKLIIRILDLLVCGGFRAGEVLTLPLDCWVEETNDTPRVDSSSGASVSNCGIRYGAKKNRQLEVKWLPHAAVPLAKRAIADLTELCRPAREMAAWMDVNPGRLFQLHNYAPDTELTMVAAMETLKVRHEGRVSQFVTQNQISVTKRGVNLFALVSDLESALRKRYIHESLFTLTSGKQQFLSESLIVIFENALHAKRGVLEFLPRQLTYSVFSASVCLTDGQLNDRLKKGVKRFDILAGKVDSAGNPLRVKSHEFRHWLNTLAANEGVSDLDLAQWMGRHDLRQNEAYKHLKASTRTAIAREMVLDGRAEGSIARTARTINDPVERAKYVESRIQAAHVTPYGMCAHNFAAAPCTRHLNCLSGATGRGCGELLRTKGSEDERAELKKLKKETEENLEKAKSAMAEGDYGSSQWIQAHENTLRGITAALAVDNDSENGNSSYVRVFPQSKSNST